MIKRLKEARKVIIFNLKQWQSFEKIIFTIDFRREKTRFYFFI